MSTHSRSAQGFFPNLPETAWDQLEQVLGRFEDAWQAGGTPTLESYLTGCGAQRQALLIELVHADLHYRIKRGEAARVEPYLERHPNLREQPRVVLDLILAEY